jgi:hypothetical protein
MVAERAAVVVVQDDQLLLRTVDHLEQVGREGGAAAERSESDRSGAATKPQKDVGKDEP